MSLMRLFMALSWSLKEANRNRLGGLNKAQWGSLDDDVLGPTCDGLYTGWLGFR